MIFVILAILVILVILVIIHQITFIDLVIIISGEKAFDYWPVVGVFHYL